MNPWKAWMYSLGLSGACIFGMAGCGGGDVPDAGADGPAAAEDGGEAGAPAEPSLPTPAPVKNELAEQPNAPGAAAPGAAPPAASALVPPAEPSASVPAVEAPAANSATAEMLAMATSAAPPSSPTTETVPGTPGAAPGALGGPQGGPQGGPPNAPGFGPADPGAGSMMIPPGSRPGGPAGGSSAEMAGRLAAQGAPGGFGSGGSSSSGGFGSAGGAQDNEPGDTKSPTGAVKAFLAAVKAKDFDRLVEATALRAASERDGGKNWELFARIFDNSMSESELDDLAKKFEGFTVAGENQVKSTGQLGVTIRKTQKEGGWLQRTVTVRKEKKGWGVLDISSPTEFDAARRTRPPGRR